MAPKIIVGLGNPEPKYFNTRHNAGWRLVDALAQAWGIAIDPAREKSKALFGEGQVGGQSVLLVKPTTYMNLSGEAVAAWVRYRSLDPSRDLLVACDEMQLAPGRLRLRQSGSAGSHNGLASVIACLGTQDFPRLRLGVGAPASAADWAGYVLKSFPPEEWAALQDALPRAEEACRRFVLGEALEPIMSRCNG
jgi:PTH1 family peptidyl-tRNA hydrolase